MRRRRKQKKFLYYENYSIKENFLNRVELFEDNILINYDIKTVTPLNYLEQKSSKNTEILKIIFLLIILRNMIKF